MYTLAEVKALLEMGFSTADIRALAEAGEPVVAESPVAEAPAPKTTPDWIVQHGINKAARRTLAAQMRARKEPITPTSWKKAKKAAGIA